MVLMADKPNYELSNAKGRIEIGRLNVFPDYKIPTAARMSGDSRESANVAYGTNPFRKVGLIRLSSAKVFGVLFGLFTAFFLCYFIWTAIFADATIFQLIGRGADLAVFAYITYSIHSEIRSRVRYDRDRVLYSQVKAMMTANPSYGTRHLPTEHNGL